MHPWQVWWRFHGAPGWQLLLVSVRQRPGLFAVAGFLVAVWSALAAAGLPLVRLPSGPIAEAGAFTAATGLAALVFAGALGAASTLRRGFFSTGARGEWQRRRVGAARAALCWAGAEGLVGALTGAGPFSWLLAGLTGVGFALVWGPVTLGSDWGSRGGAFRRGWPGPAAWWASAPEVYLVPPVVWAAAVGLISTGSAGFAWSDRLPVNALLLAFGWPAVLALGALGLPDRLPYPLFRAVRAPWGRVAAVAVGPLTVPTAAAVILAFAAAADPVQGLALASVCLSGAAFWIFLPLRFPTAGLFLPAVGVLVFVGGASVLGSAAPAWAAAQATAAAVLAVGWRTRYQEGEADADR